MNQNPIWIAIFRHFIHTTRRRLPLLLVGALVFSCMPRSAIEVPNVRSTGTIELVDLGRSTPTPFSVAHVAPQGTTEGDPAIHVVFSHPLRNVGPDVPVPAGLQLSPPVLGHWEWVGVSGLTFVPDEGRLPRASEFTVTIPSTVRSVAGETLAEGKSFTFSTPTPRITSASPNRWARLESPRRHVVLEFSQPVSPPALSGHARMSANSRNLKFRVARGLTDHQLKLIPKTTWPTNSKIEIEVSPGWKGEEGSLGSKKLFTSHFQTYGPLVATVTCSQNPKGLCRPEGGLSLELSTPVDARTLSHAISGTGARLEIDRDWYKGAQTRHISIARQLIPGSRIRVRLSAIRDVFGQPLSRLKNSTIKVGDYSPDARVGFSGDSIGAKHKKIAITALNTTPQIVTAPLSAKQLISLDGISGELKRFKHVRQLSGAKTSRLARGANNRRVTEWVELDPITENGPFVIGVLFQDERGKNVARVRWGQRTNMAVTVKRGRDAAHAWVTRLDSGAPISDAVVRVLGASTSSLTNSSGLTTLEDGAFRSVAGKEDTTQWLEIRKGSELNYRSSRDNVSEWQIPVDTDFWGHPQDLAFLFPERDLFRPGEKGWVKGYLRRPARAGNQVVQGAKLDLILQSPDSEEVARYRVETNAYGAFSARIEIPSAARIGQFSVLLKHADRRLTSTQIQVAEYRPAEFEVKTQATQPEVIAKEDLKWAIHANYFFGGVMKNAPVNYTISRRRAHFAPPGFEDHVIGDDAWEQDQPYRYIDPYLKSGQTSLSETGDTTVTFNTTLKHLTGPERVELEASVKDLSGQEQSARTSALVHPASFYLAMKRPQSSFVEAPGSIEPNVNVITPQGRTLSDRNVHLSLYRLSWMHVTRKNGEHARETVRELVRKRKTSCQFRSNQAGDSCKLKLDDAGLYVVRAHATDRSGRSALTSDFFYALGEKGAASWRDDDERGQVQIEPDRDEYQIGQEARLLIQSPFTQARAWVTVEREGVMSQKMIRVSGPSPVVKIPITEEMRPNAYVSVHLLEDRRALGAKAHAIGNSARFGYANLRIDPKRQRLKVTVKTNRADYRPGQHVKLNFRVTNAKSAGHRAEIAVFVVDEGVLSLSGYQLPDPLAAFTTRRPLRVETIEGRDRIAHVLSPSDMQNESKGDPGGGGEGERSEMLTTAYFNPSVVTDGSGRASVEFELPDNLGRFRVMALATSKDDRYGRGSTGLVVNQSLMVRPALPRFLRAGDQFDVRAVVNVLGTTKGRVEVEVEGSGVEWLGATKSEIVLEKGGAATVGFPARVNRVGSATFKLHVRGAKTSDTIALRREIQSPAQLEAVALYGKTKNAVAHRLGDLSQVRKDLGSLDVTMSSSALVGLEGGFEQLWSYPYLCTEQLSSRVLPLVALRDLGKVYGVKFPKDAEKRVNEAVAQLVRRQRGDGGFGMWPESQTSEPWVSSYALWALDEAAKRGAKIPQSTFKRGLRFLGKVAAGRQVEDLPPAVFATFVASRLGERDPASVNALFDLVDQMPVETQLMLLHAAAEFRLKKLVTPLKKRAEGAITLRGNRAEITDPQADDMRRFLSSRTRRHAITLSGLLAAEPNHRMAAPLVRSLLDARRGLGWGSTQEAAFSLFALDAYRRAQERSEPDFQSLVFFGDKLISKKNFLGRDLSPQRHSMRLLGLDGGKSVTFQRKGESGTLFFEARLKYARKKLPQAPHEAGFMVEKSMMPVSREQLRSPKLTVQDTRDAAHGELVLVHVKVLVPSRRRFVVVDDPLPAGLEAIDSSLATTASSLSSKHKENGYGNAWYRKELRDDRVLFFIDDMPPGVYLYRYLARATTPGTFVTPPTKAMEMYQEEIFGRTAAQKFVIR